MKAFILDSIGLTDAVAWVLTAIFFCGSAFLYQGDLAMSFLGAGGIIFTMFLVGTSVEVLIETMKNVPGIGTLTGFLTNGPEALVVIVGLINGDILFASSTPLGSNFMNPVLLLCAGLLTHRLVAVWRVAPLYFTLSIALTAAVAGSFYLITTEMYWLWVGVLALVSGVLFYKRPKEEEMPEDELAVSKMWFVPALLVLLGAGYFLDPVVNFASDASQVPKGIIGFLVLSTLTSWPEFKSTLALLRRNLAVAAVLNIVVSNITNLWLAGVGVLVFLLF
ncbi:MAG: sodium:proton exchanger [Magnetococcales bacterium]|nr:sodium:proton exchanger [Magnetococcales bacterium]